MKISAKKVTSELQDMWPELIDVWPMDKEFVCPTYQELKKALDDITAYRAIVNQALSDRGITVNLEFRQGAHDCDNFALELQADMSKLRVTTIEGEKLEAGILPWAFGTAICMKVRGRKINHTVNICKTSDKGYNLIEPQDFTVWTADKGRDKPYFVEMR